MAVGRTATSVKKRAKARTGALSSPVSCPVPDPSLSSPCFFSPLFRARPNPRLRLFDVVPSSRGSLLIARIWLSSQGTKWRARRRLPEKLMR